MRLLFVHDHRFRRDPDGNYYTSGSLPAAVWARYLRHFDQLHVLSRDGGTVGHEPSLALASHPGVSFETAPNLSTPRQLLRPSRAAVRQMEAAVLGADAVLARLPSELGLLAMRTAHRLGKPYAVEVVGCAYDGYLNHGKALARLYAPLVYRRARRAVARAPLALYVTAGWLQGRYPCGGEMVAASDVETVALDEAGHANRDARLRALSEGRRPTLGTVASLSIKSKGIQTAIPAIALLRKEGLDLHYALLGAGDPEPWRALARREGVEDLIGFDGTRASGAGVREWLDGIDVHLQPSFQEGLPRATIEAMSRGAACIGSTCGGLPELLPPDRTHAPGDVAGLAVRIRTLAEDPVALAAASRADLETARQYLPDVLKERQDRYLGRLREMAEAARNRSAG